ncbi:probable serine/threonine-protein kinase nek3, partial [Teleopsis dalmanni]
LVRTKGGGSSGSRYKVTARCVPEVNITSPIDGRYKQLQFPPLTPQQQLLQTKPPTTLLSSTEPKKQQEQEQNQNHQQQQQQSKKYYINSNNNTSTNSNKNNSKRATLVEEEDFNELTAVPTTTILIATNANTPTPNSTKIITKHLPPLRLTTEDSAAATTTIVVPTKNVLLRQQATQHYTKPTTPTTTVSFKETSTEEVDSTAVTTNPTTNSIEENPPTEFTPLVSELAETSFLQSTNTNTKSSPKKKTTSANATNTATSPIVISTYQPVATAHAAAPSTTTTYSHNSKTTRSWPVIYRNPHHCDYEALYVQASTKQQPVQHSSATYYTPPVATTSVPFKQNCYSNQFAQSIIYSSNEDLATAINDYGGSYGGGGGSSGNNQTQTTCYYFSRNSYNSIYEHPSAVVGSTLQFDPTTAATTAAAAAAVESLRRSNSKLLRNSSCTKIMQQTGGGIVETPTSITSAMDGVSAVGSSTCCTSCCMGPPPVLFLFFTLLMTTSATAMLCAAIMTDHWEHVTWDRDSLDRYTNRSGLHLEWMLNDKIAMLKADKRDHRFRRESVFLVPMHGGIWTLCIDLPLPELQELRRNPKFPRGAPPCVNYLAGSMENARGEEQRNDWQHSESQTTLQPHLRMQNLSISCSLVCLIILGSAALVGAFGVCQRQISAILITGVMYLLAALFALFTLMIIHFKRQQGRPMLDSDYDGTVDGIVARPGGVAIMAKPLLGARIFLTSWSLDLGWGGVVLCAITSVLWILLSKIMRYNPFSALMI